jgi:hypothetical protein
MGVDCVPSPGHLCLQVGQSEKPAVQFGLSSKSQMPAAPMPKGRRRGTSQLHLGAFLFYLGPQCGLDGAHPH